MDIKIDPVKFAAWLERVIKLNPILEKLDDQAIQMGVTALVQGLVSASKNQVLLSDMGITVE